MNHFKTILVVFWAVIPVLAQDVPKAGRGADNSILKKLDTNGDGTIDDQERRSVREKLRQRQNRPGAMTPSSKTETIGNRDVTEMEYASSDGRKIPCVLSMPRGNGPFPILVTIHGGQGNRDLAYLRTMAAPSPVSPTIQAFNEQPWAILAISYRAGNGALLAMEQEDVVAGIRFAKTLPMIDPARVAVVGGSHGGHLALVAAEKMGQEFLCFAVGSPWMTDPIVYMTGNPNQPPLSLVSEKAREALMKNGQALYHGLTRARGMSQQQAMEFLAQHSIEAHADRIQVPSLFITSRGDDQAPHVLIEPTIRRMAAAGQDVTVYTAEKSPHGFYWARTVSAARALRGEKTAEELIEETTARQKMIEFFTKHFARSNLPVVPAPAVSVATPTQTDPASNNAKGEESEFGKASERPGSRNQNGGGVGGNLEQAFKATAGGRDTITREQFKQRFANTGNPLAGKTEVQDRLFDRLDQNQDGSLTLEELKGLNALRGAGAGGGAATRPGAGARAGGRRSASPGHTDQDETTAPPTGRDSIKPSASQMEAIRRLRERTESGPVPPNLERRSLRVGDMDREFFIHVPAAVKGKPAPVVFALHGGASSSGLAMHLKADFTKLGDTEGYVTVYPSGVNGWNIGSHDMYSVQRRTSNADDVGFFRAMFDTLIAEKIADPQRIYVTGGSNGGVMTQHLVCQLADRIAGAGVVVATLPRAAETNWPKPSRPVPILVLLGTEDPMKPWNGNRDQMSADETLAYWCQQNGCSAEAKKWDLPDRDPHDGCRVRAQSWQGKATVAFYAMEGHGHGWPMQRGRDETGTGVKTRDISAQEEFWKFFKTTL